MRNKAILLRSMMLAFLLVGCATVPSEDKAVESVVVHYEASQGDIVCLLSGSYPEVTGLSSTQIEANINAYIQQYVHTMQEDIDPCPSQRVERNLHFRIERFDERFLSVVLLSSQYMDGTAHPNNTVDAMVFDMTTGQPITLEDLFINGSDYVSVLTGYVQSATEKEGVTYPSDTSNPIQTFYLTADTLVLVDLFDIHALKGFEVRIPYADLAEILL